MSNNNHPGLVKPTMASFPNGAGNPRESALTMQNNANMRQANLNAVGGKKRRYRGGANNVNVPQFQMNYTPAGGEGTHPNDQIKGLTSSGMQGAAWSKNDHLATTGGSKKRRSIYSKYKKHTRRTLKKSRRQSRRRHRK